MFSLIAAHLYRLIIFTMNLLVAEVFLSYANHFVCRMHAQCAFSAMGRFVYSLEPIAVYFVAVTYQFCEASVRDQSEDSRYESYQIFPAAKGANKSPNKHYEAAHIVHSVDVLMCALTYQYYYYYY